MRKAKSRWTYGAGRIAGIRLQVHATFLLLIGLVFLSGLYATGSMGTALGRSVYVIALFGCVLLHELGHAFAARRYGIGTRDITLLPIGGLARLERMPEKPAQELWVAVAGPLVNVGIAAILGLALAASGYWSEAMPTGTWLDTVAGLFWINISLVIFNMLPAFPLDGGRVLRALLAMATNEVTATRVAVTVGRGLALVFALAGFFYNPFLVLIAAFIWFAGRQEGSFVEMRSVLRSVPASEVMQTDLVTIDGERTLGEVVSEVMRSPQDTFPVTDREGLVFGFADKESLAVDLETQGPTTKVASLAQPYSEVEPEQTLESALLRMQEDETTVSVVGDGRRLFGLVTLRDVLRMARIRSSLGARREPLRWNPGTA